MNIDAADRTILERLQTDGRITNTELAEHVGLSPSACLRRVRALEEANVIEGYAALINPTAVDRATTVWVEISVISQEESILDEFEAEVVQHPAVRTCHLMAGDFDYLVRVEVADVPDYEKIHRTHLALLPHVNRIRSSFSLRSICDRTAYELA